MPATSKAQQRFMGAELARRRAGKSTRTDMSTADLRDFAATSHAGLPERSKRPKGSAPFSDAELSQGYRRIPS